MVSVAKYKLIQRENLKISTPKQMLEIFLIALAQVKIGN